MRVSRAHSPTIFVRACEHKFTCHGVQRARAVTKNPIQPVERQRVFRGTPVRGRLLQRGREDFRAMVRRRGETPASVGNGAGRRVSQPLRQSHPETGQRLTQRLKTTRIQIDANGERQEKRIGGRSTISQSPRRSPSQSWPSLGRMPGLPTHITGQCQQPSANWSGSRVPVHTAGRISGRNTANMVCAVFRHDTSRALDPHLHSHCIVFNAT